MSDVSDIITTVRNLIEDNQVSHIPGDIFSYGSSSVFTLSETSIDSVTSVLKNDVALSVSDYSYNSTNHKVTITASLISGDTIEIQYTYHPNFSDSELEAYIRSAVVHLSVNNFETWEVDSSDNFYPDITDSERNLIAIIASVIINKPISQYRLPDLSLVFPENLNLHDKISKIIRTYKNNSHGVFSIINELDEC